MFEILRITSHTWFILLSILTDVSSFFVISSDHSFSTVSALSTTGARRFPYICHSHSLQTISPILRRSVFLTTFHTFHDASPFCNKSASPLSNISLLLFSVWFISSSLFVSHSPILVSRLSLPWQGSQFVSWTRSTSRCQTGLLTTVFIASFSVNLCK